jgi:hypothetical protein
MMIAEVVLRQIPFNATGAASTRRMHFVPFHNDESLAHPVRVPRLDGRSGTRNAVRGATAVRMLRGSAIDVVTT